MVLDRFLVVSITKINLPNAPYIVLYSIYIELVNVNIFNKISKFW